MEEKQEDSKPETAVETPSEAPKEEKQETASPEPETKAEAAPEPQETKKAVNTDEKIFGIPQNQFVKICYLLVLASSGFAVLSNFVGLAGIFMPGGVLFAILGLGGLALTLIGWQAYSSKFSANDNTHFKYLAILFAAFFVIYFILSNALGWFGFIGALIALLIPIAQFACLYTGLSLWKAGKEANKENLMSEFEAIKSLVLSKFKKVDDGVE